MTRKDYAMTEPEPVAMINRKNVRVLADGCVACNGSEVFCHSMAHVGDDDARCCELCSHNPSPDAA